MDNLNVSAYHVETGTKIILQIIIKIIGAQIVFKWSHDPPPFFFLWKVPDKLHLPSPKHPCDVFLRVENNVTEFCVKIGGFKLKQSLYVDSLQR